MHLFADKTFRLAIMISLFSHGVFFSGFFVHDKANRNEGERRSPLEITYTRPRRSPRSSLIRKDSLAAETGGKNKIHPPSSQRAIKLAPVRVETHLKKTVFPEKKSAEMSEELIYGKEAAPEKEIVVAPHRNELPEGDVYLDYYHELRELIRRSVKYPRPVREGEIYLSFVVLRNGRIRGTPEIFSEKSTGVTAIRKAACRGIIDASPFPPFPENVRSARITFELPIFFRRGE